MHDKLSGMSVCLLKQVRSSNFKYFYIILGSSVNEIIWEKIDYKKILPLNFSITFRCLTRAIIAPRLVYFKPTFWMPKMFI